MFPVELTSRRHMQFGLVCFSITNRQEGPRVPSALADHQNPCRHAGEYYKRALRKERELIVVRSALSVSVYLLYLSVCHCYSLCLSVCLSVWLPVWLCPGEVLMLIWLKTWRTGNFYLHRGCKAAAFHSAPWERWQGGGGWWRYCIQKLQSTHIQMHIHLLSQTPHSPYHAPPPPPSLHTHTHTNMHAHMYACTHARVCTHTHTHTHACTYICMHAGTHARSHACTHRHTQTHTHTHTHTHTYARTRTHFLRKMAICC